MTDSPRRRQGRPRLDRRLRRALARASGARIRAPRAVRDAARAHRQSTALPHLTARMADDVAAGIPTAMTYQDVRIALVDADRLVQALLPHYRVTISTTVARPWRYLITIDKVPITVRAINVDAALDRMIAALRDYARAWPDQVKADPIHERRWALVQILAYLDDHEVRDWLTSTGPASAAPGNGGEPPVRDDDAGA